MLKRSDYDTYLLGYSQHASGDGWLAPSLGGANRAMRFLMRTTETNSLT